MNRVVHFEIQAKDLNAMQHFYTTVFGWDIKDMGPQMGNYRMVNTGKDAPDSKWPGISGGMTARSAPLPIDGQGVNAFVCIIEVNDIDAYIGKVKDNDGSIAVDTVDVPNVGRLAYCKDPEGNLFGMLQP